MVLWDFCLFWFEIFGRKTLPYSKIKKYRSTFNDVIFSKLGYVFTKWYIVLFLTAVSLQLKKKKKKKKKSRYGHVQKGKIQR